MLKTERILIKPNHSHYKMCRAVSYLSARLTNQALFYFRQSFFNGELLRWPSVDKLLKLRHPELYSLLPNAMSQALIKKLGADFKSFWQALKSYNKTPERFKARPRLPNYQKLKTGIQPGQGISVVDGMLKFPKKMNASPLLIWCADFQPTNSKGNQAKISELRYVPHGSCFWLEVVYDEEKVLPQTALDKRNVKLNKENVFSIDLGINNLVTLVSKLPDFQPVLFNGKPVKSLNQRFNKHKAELASLGHTRMIAHAAVKRFCQLNDYLHKVSYKIIQLCLEHDVGRIVIGKNKDWKQDINIGKVNNQKFVSIPFQSLIDKLVYKAQAYGIKVDENEESYTSKADALACNVLPKKTKASQKKQKHTFSGKRVKRGLYQSSIGKLINADVNGAINILRKVIGDDFIQGLVDKGAVFTPVRWTPSH